MALFKKPKRPPVSVLSPQTGQRKTHPFSELERYVPLSSLELKLYEAIREAIPIVDAAICKTVRLIGNFRAVSSDKTAQQQLNNFLENVPCGGESSGIFSFMSTYFDQLLMCGTAVGEMVLDRTGDFAALLNADLSNLELCKANEFKTAVCIRNDFGEPIPVPRQELLLVSTLNPAPGHIEGTSILKGLPFVSSVLLKIINIIGNNFERVGNMRYAVTYRPNRDGFDDAYAADRATEIAREWSSAMSDKSTIRDFVAVGDVDIKVIGADNQILDSSVPVRQMLEQIVAKMGLPPFMLGLSWSSTERMSAQQADILTSELEYYRSVLTPIINKICRTYLRMNGFSSDFKIEWNNINLQDEIELARAGLLKAQAKRIEQGLGG